MQYTDIGIDLGTASILVYIRGKGVVLKEPSVVAYDRDTDQILTFGEDARQMLGRTPGNIVAVRPLRQGVISDYQITEQMMKHFITKALGRRIYRKPLIAVCVPSGVTEVERKAVEDATRMAGARDVRIIEEPIAAAIGAGIDIIKPCGNMIVDIGGGTTEIAVISLGGIVSNKSIKIAGDDFNQDIIEYMGRMHNLRIDEPTAERIKIQVGSALPELEDAPEDFIVVGPNKVTALPMSVPVSYQEISHCLEKSISKIEGAILQALESTPPELYSDIVKRGIYLTGGGALLHGLARRLTDKITIPFHVADDPLHSVARGTGVALKNVNNFGFLLR